MEEITLPDGKTLFCRQGDITDADTEAIVNAANNHLWMGAGVAGAIKRKGGQAIEEAAIKQGPVEVGEAVLTHAGELASKYVIHAAVMGQDLRTDAALIEKTTLNTLKLADKHKIKSIAFPALGTGVGGFPIEKCAKIMIDQAKLFFKEAKSLEKVGFILFDNDCYKAFAEKLKSLIKS